MCIELTPKLIHIRREDYSTCAFGNVWQFTSI